MVIAQYLSFAWERLRFNLGKKAADTAGVAGRAGGMDAHQNGVAVTVQP
jgi:hypothetical protein